MRVPTSTVFDRTLGAVRTFDNERSTVPRTALAFGEVPDH